MVENGFNKSPITTQKVDGERRINVNVTVLNATLGLILAFVAVFGAFRLAVNSVIDARVKSGIEQAIPTIEQKADLEYTKLRAERIAMIAQVAVDISAEREQRKEGNTAIREELKYIRERIDFLVTKAR